MQSLKFVNNRGRVAMFDRAWVVVLTDLKNMAVYRSSISKISIFKNIHLENRFIQ